jgi:hypothetical protein
MDEERIAIVDLADELQIRKQRIFKIRVRFKVGFTMDLDGRLQKHRCSAPFAAYVKQWPCLRAWERTAMTAPTLPCPRGRVAVGRHAGRVGFSVGSIRPCRSRKTQLS